MKPDALIDDAARQSFPASDPPAFMAGAVAGAPFHEHGEEYAHRIRERAYFLWERDGRPEGRATEHWHAAERWEREERFGKT